MFSHIFKLIWNRKRKHALLITELFLSFMVFFAVLSFAIYNFNNYRMPLGYNYEDVWLISMNWGDMEHKKAWERTYQFQQQLSQYPEIKNFSFSNHSTPFGFSNNNAVIKRKNKRMNSDYYNIDATYENTLEMPLIAGRWFEESDLSSDIRPVVINQITKDSLFGADEVAVGKTMLWDEQEVQIIGVIDKYRRRNEYHEPEPAVFLQYDSARNFAPVRILIKAGENADVAFEEKMMNTLSNIAPEVTFELEYMEDKRIIANRFIVIPLVIMSVVCSFLLINVALGLFGVLWYTINQRKSEIGLRQAIGSSSNGISQLLVKEMWVLSSLGVLIGVFFAIQFPILGVFDIGWEIYLSAIGASMLLIFLLTTGCAFFPSKQATTIQPAIALREE